MEDSIEIVAEKLLHLTKDTIPKVGFHHQNLTCLDGELLFIMFPLKCNGRYQMKQNIV